MALNALDGGVVGESAKSDVCPATGLLSGAPSPPDAPTAITGPDAASTTATCDSVAIGWTAPANNGGSAVTSYTVYYGTTAAAATSAGDAGLKTTYTHSTTGVADGTIFYKVSASNKVGEGEKSADQTTGFLSACKPTAPGGLKQKAGAVQSTNSVTVTWDAVAGTATKGAPITTYTVYYTEAGAGKTAVKANTDSLTATEYTLDAKTVANGELTFQVTASNSKGESDKSTSTKFFSADKPAAPAGLVATVSEDKSKITLKWTAAVNNGAPVTGYSFSMTIGKGTAVVTKATTDAVTTTFDKIEAGNDYSFMVAATNLMGTGAYSTAVVAKVPSNVSVVQGTI